MGSHHNFLLDRDFRRPASLTFHQLDCSNLRVFPSLFEHPSSLFASVSQSSQVQILVCPCFFCPSSLAFWAVPRLNSRERFSESEIRIATLLTSAWTGLRSQSHGQLAVDIAVPGLEMNPTLKPEKRDLEVISTPPRATVSQVRHVFIKFVRSRPQSDHV